MSHYNFRLLDKEHDISLFPLMFSILHENMTKIAPTGCSYEEDRDIWMKYTLCQLSDPNLSFLLAYVGDKLAGYCQYSTKGNILTIQEVQISLQYQRTLLFYRLCCHLCNSISENIQYIDAYIHKSNENSLKISKKLGFSTVGENTVGTSWYLKAEAKSARDYFHKTTC